MTIQNKLFSVVFHGIRSQIINNICKSRRIAPDFPETDFSYTGSIVNEHEDSGKGNNIKFYKREAYGMALGKCHRPLAEMNTGNLLRNNVRPTRKADYFTAICEPIV
jgi:hypothetical protein